MIPDISFIWKQLNGPQITAITKALFAYIKEKFDDLISYFWNLSVQTANSAHLTLFGTLVGFQRPIVVKIDQVYFYFSELPPVENSPHGLSWRPGPPDPEGQQYDWGGQLSEVSPGNKAVGELADTEWYRALLSGFLHSNGVEGSLVLLNDIIVTLSSYDNPDRPPYFIFTYTLQQEGVKSPGDIDIDLDNIIPWRDPYTSYELMVSIANGMYAPVPKIYPILQGVNTLENPDDDVSKKLLQFLSQESLWIKDVSGLPGYALTPEDFPDIPDVTWNTKKDGTGDVVGVGYQLYGNTILYAYPISQGGE